MSPRMTITLLTAACLVAFAVTIPIPRVDGQLLGSDGLGYYAYLPSLVLDGDLDFTNEYTHLYGHDPRGAAAHIESRTPTGLPANRFAVGPALFWLPFFLAAHLVALIGQTLGWDIAADGYGYLYQAAVIAGSIVYGGLGIFFAFCAARRFASRDAALFATLTLVLAGNAIYYLTIEPSMSHAVSIFASALFVHAWLGCRRPAELGAFGGLMGLVRPQDALLLMLPFVDLLMEGRSRRTSPGAFFSAVVATTGAVLLVFSPQLLVWHVLNGSFWRSGYSTEFGELFHWTSPAIWSVLGGTERGLFLWHPVYLPALVGLGLLARSDRRTALLAFLGFAVQAYVIASWRDPAQGEAFGGRMFLVCFPLFAVGLAVVVERAASALGYRRLAVLAAILVAVNFLLMVQYRIGFLHRL